MNYFVLFIIIYKLIHINLKRGPSKNPDIKTPLVVSF